MKLTIEDFAMKLLMEFTKVRYFGKELVFAEIKSYRKHRGINCDGSDEEVYDCFRRAWNNLVEEGMLAK